MLGVSSSCTELRMVPQHDISEQLGLLQHFYSCDTRASITNFRFDVTQVGHLYGHCELQRAIGRILLTSIMHCELGEHIVYASNVGVGGSYAHPDLQTGILLQWYWICPASRSCMPVKFVIARIWLRQRQRPRRVCTMQLECLGERCLPRHCTNMLTLR
jgi:hypothetical protein